MVKITLTEDEFWEATRVGAQRHFRSVCDGRRMRIVTANDDGWRNHIEGACAELAAAKHTKLKWHGAVDAFGKPDLGLWVDVKLRRNEECPLIIKEHEPDDWFYILVHGTAPHFKLRGWIVGKQGKLVGTYYPGKGKNCGTYAVPHEALTQYGGDDGD